MVGVSFCQHQHLDGRGRWVNQVNQKATLGTISQPGPDELNRSRWRVDRLPSPTTPAPPPPIKCQSRTRHHPGQRHHQHEPSSRPPHEPPAVATARINPAGPSSPDPRFRAHPTTAALTPPLPTAGQRPRPRPRPRPGPPPSAPPVPVPARHASPPWATPVGRLRSGEWPVRHGSFACQPPCTLARKQAPVAGSA